jgi:hypothetical protein
LLLQKRRAQIREAQRAYQKRKDSAIATEKRRADDLLQVLSDLSTDVEALLQAASKAGMPRDDDVSKQIQRLRSTYDAAINNDCVQPELRLQQIKNNRLLADSQNRPHLGSIPASRDTQEDCSLVTSLVPVSERDATTFNYSDVSLELVRHGDTAVIQSYRHDQSYHANMAGRIIYDVCANRREAMRSADRHRIEDWT